MCPQYMPTQVFQPKGGYRMRYIDHSIEVRPVREWPPL